MVIVSGCDAHAYSVNEEAEVGRVATPGSDASVTPPKLDVPSSDASVEMDASEDIGTVTRPLGLFTDGTQILSGEECNASSLHLSSALFRAGYTVWHLCFRVQDLSELADDKLDLRVEGVRFYVGHDPNRGLESIVPVMAPFGRHEWTANIAVALPTEWAAPRFNVQQTTVEGPPSIEWSLDGDGYGGLRQFGWFHAWRVDRSGHQTEVELHPTFSACDGMTRPMGFPAGNYVPEGACPSALMTCLHMGGYYCSK